MRCHQAGLQDLSAGAELQHVIVDRLTSGPQLVVSRFLREATGALQFIPYLCRREPKERLVNQIGLYQVLSAAIVDSEFRESLLVDPARAIESGYLGQTFALTEEERLMIHGIEASGLAAMAVQIEGWLAENGNGRSQSNGRRNGHVHARLDSTGASPP